MTIGKSEGIIKEKGLFEQGEENEPERQYSGEGSIQRREQTPPTYITYTPSVVDLEAPQKIEGRDEDLAKYIASILRPITKYATETSYAVSLKDNDIKKILRISKGGFSFAHPSIIQFREGKIYKFLFYGDILQKLMYLFLMQCLFCNHQF